MTSFTSGVGLASGLPIQEMVNAMIAVQQQPILLLQNRVSTLVTQRTTFLSLSAQILSIQNSAGQFESSDFFQRTSATSSLESSILATADIGAAIGQYVFTVRNLASSHQLVSGGFATRNETPVGAGTLTFESNDALVDQSTLLSTLNGGEGVQAGKIRITDRTGQVVDVDLISADTIQDVINTIVQATGGNVTGRVEGDHLVLEDNTGAASGSLIVADIGTGQTAADLGIVGNDLTGSITGQDLVQLAESTRLVDLNDGNGIRRVSAQPDFSISLADGSVFDFDLSEYLTEDTSLAVLNRGAGVPSGSIHITNRAGVEADIDLSSAKTVGDVKTAIEAAGLDLAVAFSGENLLITDSSTGEGELVIEDIGDGLTADALGISGSSSAGTITGHDIYAIETLGDVLRIINTHADNDDGMGGRKLNAAIASDGTHLVLTDNTSGAATFEVTALNDSTSADDLGILKAATGNTLTSGRLLAGLDTVLLRSLNGGSGVELGQIQITDRAGTGPVTIDLTGAETLADIVQAINDAPVDVTAAISGSGLGIELHDNSGGTGNLVIADITGSVADDLNITFNDAADTVSSGNLQRQYVSGATLLTSLGSNGVPSGKFRITNSNGETATVDLTQGNEKTLQDVIDEINSRGIDVVARINDTGDGLLIEDQAGGSGTLKVFEDGGSTARALGIFGQAEDGETHIDGAFETRITVTNQDTLEDVLDKIRSSGALVNAAIINDGDASRPFRLSVSSTVSGRDGAIALDIGTTGLSFDTLMEAQDATVIFGSPDAANPLVLKSASNSLNDAVSGVRLELIAPSDEAVTISVSQDLDAVVSGLSSFVAAFNSAMSSINSATGFDSETEQRSILTGDATVRRIRQRLTGMVFDARVEGVSSSLGRLSDVGITLKNGTTLSFDETKFREAYENDPEGVVELFTREETNDEGETINTGLGGLIRSSLERLTDDETGLIPLQTQTLRDSEQLLNDRIDQMQVLLEVRRERYLAEFYAMETAISQMQSQQSALAGLTTLGST